MEMLCPKIGTLHLTPVWLMFPNHSLYLLLASAFRLENQRTVSVWCFSIYCALAILAAFSVKAFVLSKCSV